LGLLRLYDRDRPLGFEAPCAFVLAPERMAALLRLIAGRLGLEPQARSAGELAGRCRRHQPGQRLLSAPRHERHRSSLVVQRMGIKALYPRPNSSKPKPGLKVFP